MHRFKYLMVYLVPAALFISLNTEGILTFISIFVFFLLVPLVELFIPPDTENMDVKIAEDEKNKSIYDWFIYLSVPIQVLSLVYFLVVIQHTAFGSIEYFGRITAMGLMCSVIGINVGHELGHRHKRWESFLGEVLLSTSLYLHFRSYHNAGHHLHVATPEDPATAARGESLYPFSLKSELGGYIKAWQIENNIMRRHNESIFSLNNRMAIYTLVTVFTISAVYFFFGFSVLIAFLLASSMGIMLLQATNYIEHYGLLREKNESGQYQPVRHQHSWNSDHPIGRAILFNLSRHSDHHYNGSKKYQILQSIESSPQMPTGYPGMLLLAFIPPLWFRVMNKKLDEIGQK